MNLIELTGFMAMTSGVACGAMSGHGFWGMIGLFLGAIYGFAIGLGIALLLYNADRLTLGWGRTNRGAILSLALSFGLGFVGPILSGATAVAVTLLIHRWI